MAVPSSGAISLTGLAGEKLNNDYDDQDFDDVISLTAVSYTHLTLPTIYSV